MLNKKSIIEYILSNKEYFENEFKIKKIGIFGSFALDRQREDSDIDLIVEFQNDTDNLYDIKLKLSELLKNQFHREIDIAREKYLKPRVKDEILKEAIYVE